MEPLLEEVKELHRLYNQQTDEWLTGFLKRGGKIFCRRGCHNCCSLVVNCTFPEALWISRHLPEEFVEPLKDYAVKVQNIAAASSDLKSYLKGVRNQAGGCPFLAEDGSCGIYIWRPLSCRSLLSTKDPKYCAADFSSMPQDEKGAFLASLDRSVVRFPTAYIDITQQLAQQMEMLILAQMLEREGVSISGNMPYQVWLEREHDLGLRFSWGKGEALRYLASQDLARNYLLDIQKGAQKVHLTPRRGS